MKQASPKAADARRMRPSATKPTASSAESRQLSEPNPSRSVMDGVRERLAQDQLPAWVLLPLRLFLGVTFVYAGLQKLTDPQFFDPHAIGYIGKQLTAFARNSPLHDLLLNVAVPHAAFFGGLVAYGELAIGLGVLMGLLLRPAAFFGALLSFIFFLSASWNVHPYFYGPDIVFFFAWLPVLLAGPAHAALPAIDNVLAPRLLSALSPERRTWLAPVVAFVLGRNVASMPPVQTEGNVAQIKGTRAATRYSPRPGAYHTALGRRDFLWGAGAGGLGMLGLAWLWNVLHGADVTTTTVTTPIAGATEVGGAATSTATASNVIARVSDVAANSAVSFTIPTNGDPGVLVKTAAGKLVAFDATCTHQGCPVQYDSTSQLLQCPCHGAAFDPTQNAAVVQGPAQTPLTAVAITVNQQTGDITLAS